MLNQKAIKGKRNYAYRETLGFIVWALQLFNFSSN